MPVYDTAQSEWEVDWRGWCRRRGRVKIYRGFHGLTGQQKIVESQRGKGVLAEFPDCKTLW